MIRKSDEKSYCHNIPSTGTDTAHMHSWWLHWHYSPFVPWIHQATKRPERGSLLFVFTKSLNKLLNKLSSLLWINTPWRLCDLIVMIEIRDKCSCFCFPLIKSDRVYPIKYVSSFVLSAVVIVLWSIWTCMIYSPIIVMIASLKLSVVLLVRCLWNNRVILACAKPQRHRTKQNHMHIIHVLKCTVYIGLHILIDWHAIYLSIVCMTATLAYVNCNNMTAWAAVK